MSPRAVGAALRRIGPHPLLLCRYTWHKGRVIAQQRRLRRDYAGAVASPPPGATLVAPGARLPPVEQLPAPLREAALAIRAEADRALAGRATLLGVDDMRLGEPIAWDLDFASGYRWPGAFYQDLEVTRLDDDSDAKVPWELSRGHQLVALARARVLFGDERCLAALEQQLGEWLAANPAGHGINWANPMEVAIRALNWCWAIGTLDRASVDLDRELRRRVTESLQVHGRHIAANLEGTPYLRGNHYMADVLGLLVLGSCIEGDPAAARWARRAHLALEREVLSQVLPDGIGFEASLPYHGLSLEMLLLARHVARVSGAPFSERFDERLRRMSEASIALRQADGRIPQFGDSDSGRILPADSSRPPVHDHLIWLAAAELGLPRPLPGPADPEVAWILGPSAWSAVAEARQATSALPTRFDDAGIFVLAGGGSSVVVRCGDVGQNGNGGHAHNDLLSFELFRDGPLVVDSGTYTYTADPAARNAFRSAAAHNTIVVDGEEPNPIDPADLFRLRQLARPTVHAFETTAAGARLCASHDGYRRLSCGATHRRELRLDGATGDLSIVDSIDGRGECECVAYVHLASGTRVHSLGPDTVAAERAGTRASVRFEGLSELETQDGWVSDEYGRRERAPVLVGRRLGELPASISCSFNFER